MEVIGLKENTRIAALTLTRTPTLTYELMKRNQIQTRPIQTVGVNSYAVGRRRLVSTFVEKEGNRI